MPGTTAYPGALDAFPTIDGSTQENAPGTEHDVVHANEMAAIAALQVKVGVDGSSDATSLDARVAAVESGKLDAGAVGVSVAALVGGVVPAGQLPSYVDDVLEVATHADLPAVGEAGKIYVTVAAGPDPANSQYRWSASGYVLLVASPGSSDAVPEGATNKYYTDERAQDAIAAMIAAGAHVGITFVYDDAANTLTATVTGGGGGASDPRDTWLLG